MATSTTHVPVVAVVDWRFVAGLGMVQVHARTCSSCGRRVARRTGERRWVHAGSGRPKGPHTPAQRAAISAGMRAAHARRLARDAGQV